MAKSPMKSTLGKFTDNTLQLGKKIEVVNIACHGEVKFNQNC